MVVGAMVEARVRQSGYQWWRWLGELASKLQLACHGTLGLGELASKLQPPELIKIDYGSIQFDSIQSINQCSINQFD